MSPLVISALAFAALCGCGQTAQPPEEMNGTVIPGANTRTSGPTAGTSAGDTAVNGSESNASTPAQSGTPSAAGAPAPMAGSMADTPVADSGAPGDMEEDDDDEQPIDAGRGVNEPAPDGGQPDAGFQDDEDDEEDD